MHAAVYVFACLLVAASGFAPQLGRVTGAAAPTSLPYSRNAEAAGLVLAQPSLEMSKVAPHGLMHGSTVDKLAAKLPAGHTPAALFVADFRAGGPMAAIHHLSDPDTLKSIVNALEAKSAVDDTAAPKRLRLPRSLSLAARR